MSAVVAPTMGAEVGLAVGFGEPVTWVVASHDRAGLRIRRLDRSDAPPSPGADTGGSHPFLLEVHGSRLVARFGSGEDAATQEVEAAHLGIPADATFTRVGLYANGGHVLFALPRVGSEARAPTPGNR